MAQVEQPANLDRWHNPEGRLLTLILMRCGLRVGDATKIGLDCVVRDADGAPYLRYSNRKMKREALVPIDEELEPADHRAAAADPATAGPTAAGGCSPPPDEPRRRPAARPPTPTADS